MIKTIGFVALGFAVAIGAMLAYATTRPDTFRIARSTSIKAPAEKIFPLINDLRAQATWSPFEKDPNMKRTHSGSPQGTGAVYEWAGNSEVGAGRIAITDSRPSSRVTLALDMIKPFAAHNIVEFTLEPSGGSTGVTWSMHGEQPFIAKVMSVFIDCEKMVAPQFEEGLARLKRMAEAQAIAASPSAAR